MKTIFTDDIVYKTDLDALIKKEILAKPICQEYNTDILLGSNIGIKDEELSEPQLNKLLEICAKHYFNRNMIPSYNPKDIEYLLKFYAQKEFAPLFVTFDDLDRKRLDLSTVAKRIHDEDMRRSEEAEYIQNLWDEEGSIFPIYYTNFYFFKKVIQSELDKISGDIPIVALKPQTLTEKKRALTMTLQQLIDIRFINILK